MPTILEKLKAFIQSEEEDEKIVLKSVDEEHRLFLGVVLEPEEYDLHKDIYSGEAVRKACELEQSYLQSNVQHVAQVDNSVVEVTKSFIQEVEATIGDQVIKAGTWLREAKIHNDSLWEAVKKGEFTGWSIGCTAQCDDVPVSCIKSEEDIEKAKWDREKFQRLDNFDFSAEGAHIALVDRAANGWKALVIKSADPVEEKPVVKEEDKATKPEPVVAKSNDGDKPKMSDDVKVMKAEDVEALITKAIEATKSEFQGKLDEQASQIEKHEAAEEVRKEAKFAAMTKKYEVLGDVEGVAEVLKGLEAVEGFDKLIALLDSAVTSVSKADLMEEQGSSEEGEDLSSMEELKKLAAVKASEKSISISKAMVEVAAERPDLVK